MLEKVKAIGTQAGELATGAASSLTSLAGSAVGGATDAAVRMATQQLAKVLRVAAEEFRKEPLPPSGILLTASVGIAATSLQATLTVLPDSPKAPANPDTTDQLRNEQS